MAVLDGERNISKKALHSHARLFSAKLHKFVAERTRFELVVGLLLRQFSKLVVSATHPPLQSRCEFITKYVGFTGNFPKSVAKLGV